MNAIFSQHAPAAIGPYSQAIQAGNLLFVSGQIPLNPVTGSLVEGDIEAETKQVMENIEAILKAAGASFNNVAKTSIFLTNMGDFNLVNGVYAGYFTNGVFPARETVQVAGLPKNVRVEISVTAIV